MKLKIVGLALFLGGLTSILLLTLPTPKEISSYEGSEPPTASTVFIDTPEVGGLCSGVNFGYYASKVKVGYPIKYTVTVDYSGCSPLDRFGTTTTSLTSSLTAWQFYTNWLIWTLAWLGFILICFKSKNGKKIAIIVPVFIFIIVGLVVPIKTLENGLPGCPPGPDIVPNKRHDLILGSTLPKASSQGYDITNCEPPVKHKLYIL